MQAVAFATIGTMVGLVAGIVLVAVPISNGAEEWFRPSVVGPAIGAFLAALIGVCAAIWSHYSEIRHRAEEQKTVTKTAIIKLIAATIGLYAYFRMYRRALQKIAEEGKAQPVLMDTLQSHLKQSAKDVKNAAMHDALPPGISAAAIMLTQGHIQNSAYFSFTEDFLEQHPLGEEHVFADEDRAMLKDILPMFDMMDKSYQAILHQSHIAANLPDAGDDFGKMADDAIKQINTELSPLVTL